MNLLRTAAQGLKVAKGFNLFGTGTGSGYYPRVYISGTDHDYLTDAGPMYDNGVVQTIIQATTKMLGSPGIGIQYLDDPDDEQSWRWIGRQEKFPNMLGQRVQPYEIVTRLVDPNPDYGFNVLLSGWACSDLTRGNAYLIKRRSNRVGPNGRGVPIGFWYVPHFNIRPSTEGSDKLGIAQDGTRLITHYVYTPLAGGEPIDLHPEDVVHFRNGMNPAFVAEGYSPLYAVLREICTDNEASTFSATVLRNMGVPSVIMSLKMPKEGELPSKEARKRLGQAWQDYTGDGRGYPFVAPEPIDVHKGQFSPEEMVLDKVRNIPMHRICAVAGFDPMSINLPSETKTYSNYEEARVAAYEDTVIPKGETFCFELFDCLADDWGLDRDRFRLAFKWHRVPALARVVEKRWERAGKAWDSGFASLNEVRAVAELPPDGRIGNAYKWAVTPGGEGKKPTAAEKMAEQLSLRAELLGKSGLYRSEEHERSGIEQ